MFFIHVKVHMLFVIEIINEKFGSKRFLIDFAFANYWLSFFLLVRVNIAIAGELLSFLLLFISLI